MKWKSKSQEDAALWRGLILSGARPTGGDLDAWGRALDCVTAEYRAAIAIVSALPKGSSASYSLSDQIDAIGQQLCEDLAAYGSRVEDYTAALEAKNLEAKRRQGAIA